MARWAEIQGPIALSAHFNGGGVNYTVQTPTGVLYLVYVDAAQDVSFRKSLDHGLTWGNATNVFTGTVTNLAIWYDRWSNISAGLIHIAYTESVGADTLYRTIDTESSDALSTQTTIFAGVSTAANGYLTISRARGGNVYCKTQIDSGAEGGFFRLPNANVPNGAWDAARTIDEALAGSDHMILVPGFAADNQDMLAIFWDASSNEVSRKIYDDSANSWAETSIAISMVELSLATAFSNFAAAVDLTNSQIVMVAWSDTDVANSDLRCWKITESAITEVTNVVLNSVDDQGLAAIGIDTVTGYWTVFYAGKSDGSETWPTALNVYCKVSKDAGSTWGAETQLTGGTQTFAIKWLVCTPRHMDAQWGVAFYNDQTTDLIWSVTTLPTPRATYVLGIS